MGGIPYLSSMQGAGLTSDDGPAHRFASVSEPQESFDETETGQHSLLLSG